MEKFAVRLKELRTGRRIYQREVAEAINISVRTYQAYELGETEPNITRLVALADFFQVPLDYLMGRSDTL